VPIPPERVQDPYEHNAPGLGVGRDPARTPMPWSAASNGGFCPPDAQPWLPLGDVAGLDVASQRRDPRSTLGLHRRLLALRRASQALSVGGYRTVAAGDATFAYLRESPGEAMLVALNLSDAPQAVPLGQLAGRVRLTSHLDGRDDDVHGELRLCAAEGVVVEIAPVNRAARSLWRPVG
jgi:alpha-glucosidase